MDEATTKYPPVRRMIIKEEKRLLRELAGNDGLSKIVTSNIGTRKSYPDFSEYNRFYIDLNEGKKPPYNSIEDVNALIIHKALTLRPNRKLTREDYVSIVRQVYQEIGPERIEYLSGVRIEFDFITVMLHANTFDLKQPPPYISIEDLNTLTKHKAINLTSDKIGPVLIVNSDGGVPIMAIRYTNANPSSKNLVSRFFSGILSPSHGFELPPDQLIRLFATYRRFYEYMAAGQPTNNQIFSSKN